MAPIPVELVLSSGLVSVVLLLLSIFVTALCSDCKRRSFELQESDLEKNPSTLIKVVRLEDAVRENPMMNEIQNDEKDVQTSGRAEIKKTGNSSDAAGDSNPEEEASVTFTPWRSHLRASSSQDPDSAHIYHTIVGGRGSTDAGVSSNKDEGGSAAVDLTDMDRNSVYARVSKKERQAPPPQCTSEDGQVEVEPEEEESPPLPDRTAELDG